MLTLISKQGKETRIRNRVTYGGDTILLDRQEATRAERRAKLIRGDYFIRARTREGEFLDVAYSKDWR